MIYTDGTIAIKAGSPIVTGTGTQWKKNIHGVAPGQMISIENGANPINMMIRAVNSDTELVLSFNAPVARSGAKYSIATTVPDTISDAARTMSANQGYIVYFLQAMQQWMTDTGQIEIELPNGQKVTLDSIKALNEAIKNIDKKVDDIKIPEATTEQKGVVQISASIGESTTKVPHEKAVSDALDKKANNNDLGTAAKKNVGIYEGNVIGTGQSGLSAGNMSQPPNGIWSHNPSGLYGLFGEPINNTRIWGSYLYMPFNSTEMQFLVTPVDGDIYLWVMRQDKYGNKKAIEVMTYNNFITDSNGFIKKSSPIIQINPKGNFETNDESEGAYVHRTDTGQYHITGILGYNSDGAWGVNGGISVPKDNNGLELVYVADQVLEDGGIIVETCHRQHTHLPDKFQNWRLKEITADGDRVFYQDGEPCDLPEYTRLDVRVEMPQGSVWNLKQRELAEQMEREVQEAAEQAGAAEE